MNVLVTGSTGQVALSLVDRAALFPRLRLSTIGRPDFDLERPQNLRAALLERKPDVLINAAAYTAVDQAELEPERAGVINGEAPGVLAGATHEMGIPFIHLSTDYVFDGRKGTAYVEADSTGPTSVYGSSKLAGEVAARQSNPDSMIVRTSWVYSPFGRNFVKTMLALAETRDEVRVVSDQLGTPTSALALAEGLLTAVERWRDGHRVGQGQTYHLAGAGKTDWSDFAMAVFDEARQRGIPSAKVTPISTAEYPTRAVRPANSALNSSKFSADFGWSPPDWRSSLCKVFDRLPF